MPSIFSFLYSTDTLCLYYKTLSVNKTIFFYYKSNCPRVNPTQIYKYKLYNYTNMNKCTPVLFHRVRNFDKVALDPSSFNVFRMKFVSSFVSRVPASLSSAITVLKESYHVRFKLYLHNNKNYSKCYFFLIQMPLQLLLCNSCPTSRVKTFPPCNTR